MQDNRFHVNKAKYSFNIGPDEVIEVSINLADIMPEFTELEEMAIRNFDRYVSVEEALFCYRFDIYKRFNTLNVEICYTKTYNDNMSYSLTL